MLYSQIKNIRKKTNFSFKKTGKRHKKDGSFLVIKIIKKGSVIVFFMNLRMNQ